MTLAFDSFRIDNTDHIIDVNKNNFPYDYDQVNIICPTYDKSTDDRDTEKYIIYNVSKEEYDTCRITTLHPRVITVCNKPYDLMYVTITFRPFSPQPNGLEFRPGVDYYFISTSSSDDLERRIGGRCSSHHMKVVFKVCCDANKQSKPLGDQGGVQVPSNGLNNRGLIAGSNDTHKISTTTSLSTSKSGRVSSTTTLTPPTTTSTSTSLRRRRPYHNSGEHNGRGGTPYGGGGSPYGEDNYGGGRSPYDNARPPYGSGGSPYEYSDYAAVHKDYPYYVKTTTMKYDPRKYPDPRQNEIVKNEALNASPRPQPLLLWTVIAISAAVVFAGQSRWLLGPFSKSGHSEQPVVSRSEACANPTTKRSRLTTSSSSSSRPAFSLVSSSCSGDAEHMQLRQHQSLPSYDVASSTSRKNCRSTKSTSSLGYDRYLLTPLTPSEQSPNWQQQQLHQLQEHQENPRWVPSRRHVSSNINSYRCRARASMGRIDESSGNGKSQSFAVVLSL
ncbi:Ephrin receptor-binding domain [Trinorchestia longiramus]|nr:Ephrin receptor-binding domain [Trinorchestia longiramus]